jgi:hypothetical protein
LSIAVGVVRVGDGVRCHALDDRCVVFDERGMRRIIYETSKFTLNRITRQQDARFERLNQKTTLTLAFVTTDSLAAPQPKGQQVHKPPHRPTR